jgi:hypothetical protein
MAPVLPGQILPRNPVLVGGEREIFRVDEAGQDGGPFRWSVLEPDGGWVDPDSGQYVAPQVSAVGRFHIQAQPAGPSTGTSRNLGTLVTVLPRLAFEGAAVQGAEPERFPFLIPGSWRRFQADGMVRNWEPSAARPGCCRLRTGFLEPVTLTWEPIPGAERELLSYREGDDIRCLEVTGQGRLALTPKGRVSNCFLEALAHDQRGGWKSFSRYFCISVEGLLPFAGEWSTPGNCDDPGSAARFRQPSGIAVLGGGLHSPCRIVVADAVSHRLRLLSRTGAAEGGWGQDLQPGHRDGGPLEARFNGPTFLAVNRWFESPQPWQYSYEFLVADTGNQVLRQVDPGGAVRTWAGVPGQVGHRDGPRDQALFSGPRGLAMDPDGNVYVADQGNHVIRKIERRGPVTTLAGAPGRPGTQDGLGNQALFHHLNGLASGADGHLYGIDGHALRRITKGGEVRTILGRPDRAGFADRPGREGEPGGPGVPCMRDPGGVIAVGSRLFIADQGNHALRQFEIQSGRLTTLVGGPALPRTRFGRPGRAGPAPGLREPRDLAMGEGGEIYITTGAAVAVWCCPPRGGSNN